jgi:GntR family transcriptional regulator / MocR family aminotransferase
MTEELPKSIRSAPAEMRAQVDAAIDQQKKITQRAVRREMPNRMRTSVQGEAKIMDLAFLNFLHGTRATTPGLAAAITQAVDSGILVPGDKMPSTRELSVQLGISRTTAVRAFDNLIARGYLSAVKGAGTVVSDAVTGQKECDFSPGEDRQFVWSGHYSEMAKQQTLRASWSATSGDFDVIDNGAVPGKLLPTSDWRSIHSSYCRPGFEDKLTTRQEIFGYSPLRDAIAQFLRRTKGIICDPDQVVLYSGPQAALTHVADLMVRRGQTALCENPSYPVAREQFRIRGAQVLPVPVDEQGLVTDYLKGIDRPVDWLYLTPSCQDPTGAILSEQRRKELLDWCWANNTAIIEDAWDSDFRFGGNSPTPLFAMDATASVIYLFNFWRMLFPLSSIGVAVLPEALVPLFKNSKYLCDRQFPTIEHYVLSEFLASGKFDKHMRSVWKTYRSRRQALIFELKRLLTDRVTTVSQPAGMQFIARFHGDWTQEQIMRAAASASLPMAPTDSYYFDRQPDNEFIVHFASVDKNDVESIVHRFVSALN